MGILIDKAVKQIDLDCGQRKVTVEASGVRMDLLDYLSFLVDTAQRRHKCNNCQGTAKCELQKCRIVMVVGKVVRGA